ncbi:Exosome complex component RRP41 [Phytophthora boehmeriae]|uniref:Exosome complex component RRP41 n=1 Tax=Phytophthora boehmeriae TaxID=109152 RepID=A0A8T1WVX3_9STRA|nr:Exosome complex component RRP41 [Phytophthora boehmeriae]
MTATADVVKSPEQMKPSERQESENLAWMDMMLALLERRYGSHSNLPVCVSDLEAANMFQSPSPKRYKADIAPVAQPTPFDSNNVARPRISLENSIAQVNVGQHQATGGAAVTRRSQATVDEKSLTLNTQQIPARFSQEQEEQAKEEKRQRLLLRHAQQIQSSSVSSSTSCGCKTGCLKMYCMCFSSRGFCHSGCACEDCKNSRNNKTERVEAIQSYLANDPRSFSFASLPRDANKTGFLHLLPQKSSAVVMRGCRCKKSKCLKKYCECFQNGIACTAHCRCMDCSNHCESSVAHEHHHLQKGSATSHGKHAYSGAGVSSNDRPKPFHPVQITVTKQPRRNRVSKTLRLNL